MGRPRGLAPREPAPAEPRSLRWANRGAGIALALVLTLSAGLLLGLVAGRVIWSPPPPGASPAPALVQGDLRALVLQPEDLSPDSTIYEDPNSTDPANTNALSRYAVRVTRKDSTRYLAEAGVYVYGGREKAASGLRALLSVGKFGTELPVVASLGDEAHLFAAKDKDVVIGSVLWRDRNAVAFVFVFNPYTGDLTPEVVDRLAKANAHDDTVSMAAAMAQRIHRS